MSARAEQLLCVEPLELPGPVGGVWLQCFHADLSPVQDPTCGHENRVLLVCRLCHEAAVTQTHGQVRIAFEALWGACRQIFSEQLWGKTQLEVGGGVAGIAEGFPVTALSAPILQPWEWAGPEEATEFPMRLVLTGITRFA